MPLSRRELFALAAAVLQARGADKQGMIVRSTRPEDLEMPPDGFSTWITPVEKLFVRHHHYAARVEVNEWKLEVGGLVDKPVSLTYEQIRKLPRVEQVAVIECAGNGRGLYEPSVPGLQWEQGAVGNVRWAGVRLVDVLRMTGVKTGAREVLMDGADQPIGTMPKFQRTLPLTKAMHSGTLLAYELNGQPLPPIHGFPLRVIASGWASDSWTKWLSKLTLLDKDFEGFFMATAYRHPVKPVPPGSAVDPKQMRPVTDLRVKSVIASPVDGSSVAPGAVKISGVAWTGPGQVVEVRVSLDAGRTWNPARLGAEQSKYGWRLWEFMTPPLAAGYYNVMAQARDSAGDVQPLTAEWNPSGYLWNVVPRIGLAVGMPAAAKPAAAPETPPLPQGFKTHCLTCHEMDVITQQRLTKGQWEREVDKMIRWGAPVKPEDRTGIIEFLSGRYSPTRR